MRKLIIHALIVLSVFVASSALGSNADSLFNSAGNYYQNQDYDEALRLYLEIEQK
ncbi:MAG: hypothetical protein GY865_12800, partial [candidate division Zixibacteria bacterium]|nr:hypothetical protein [candidate division Zixibacteria bacterium]